LTFWYVPPKPTQTFIAIVRPGGSPCTSPFASTNGWLQLSIVPLTRFDVRLVRVPTDRRSHVQCGDARGLARAGSIGSLHVAGTPFATRP
jgi:hypothetical protein